MSRAVMSTNSKATARRWAQAAYAACVVGHHDGECAGEVYFFEGHRVDIRRGSAVSASYLEYARGKRGYAELMDCPTTGAMYDRQIFGRHPANQ